MGDILKYEQIVYSALTAIYIIIMNIVQGDDNGDSSSPIMLVIATYLGARFLPLSMGSVILYSVLNIVAIIWGACELKKRLNKKKANGRVFNDNISRSSRWFYLFTHS